MGSKFRVTTFKIFVDIIFQVASKATKFMKILVLKNFRLYGIGKDQMLYLFIVQVVCVFKKDKMSVVTFT